MSCDHVSLRIIKSYSLEHKGEWAHLTQCSDPQSEREAASSWSHPWPPSAECSSPRRRPPSRRRQFPSCQRSVRHLSCWKHPRFLKLAEGSAHFKLRPLLYKPDKLSPSPSDRLSLHGRKQWKEADCLRWFITDRLWLKPPPSHWCVSGCSLASDVTSLALPKTRFKLFPFLSCFIFFQSSPPLSRMWCAWRKVCSAVRMIKNNQKQIKTFAKGHHLLLRH